MTNVPQFLRELLVKTFSARSYPGDERIAVNRPWTPEYEGNQVTHYFRGKRWQDITLEGLTKEYSGDAAASFHFMTDEGFLYYLPAFLSAALDLSRAGNIADALCAALSPTISNADEEDIRRINVRLRSLSPEEKNAVRQVLGHLALEYERMNYPDNPARTALLGIEGASTRH